MVGAIVAIAIALDCILVAGFMDTGISNATRHGHERRSPWLPLMLRSGGYVEW